MAKRPAEYRLSPAATRDLESIWLYTLERWGLEQATRYTDELVAVFNELAENPALGTPADHIRKTYRRRRLGRHVIYFHTTEYVIAVIRVLHDRMDLGRHL